MLHPETHAITSKHGPRPAGRPTECFYCHGPLGADHAPDCVLRSRTIVATVTITFVAAIPERWTVEDFEFHRNESSYCASNVLEELDNNDNCLCGATEFRYLREATTDDEQELPGSVGH